MEHFESSLGGCCTYRQFYRWAAQQVPLVGARCVEVGVLYGQGVAFLAVEMLNRGCTGAKIDLVDSGAFLSRTKANLAPAGDIIGDAHQCLSWDGAAFYDDASLDFVFIDASHLRCDVEKDLAAWLPKVRIGGLIAGHDMTPELPGVQEAVQSVFDHFDVWRGEPFENGRYYPSWSARRMA